MTAKADRAQRLIDDPDLKEAFSTVRERYRDLIEETPLDKPEVIFDIRKMLHLLRDVEQNLHEAIQTGHLEDFRVTEQAKHGHLRNLLWKKEA